MNFIPSAEHKQLSALARKAAQDLIAPIVAADEEAGTFRPEVIKKLGDLGLTGIPISSTYGGADLGYFEYALALEEIGAHSSAYAISVAVSGLPQIILSMFGSEAQNQK